MLEDDGCYDDPFSSLTEEELAEIDLILRADPNDSQLTPNTAQGGPSIPIEIESEISEAGVSEIPPTDTTSMRCTRTLSPFQRFRPKSRSLSVTDIVAPVWCEVQFYYGLTQRRWAPVETRPPKFKTDAGKTIVVEQKIAKRNDKTLKRGTRVHVKLEKEVHKEKVIIATKTEEEVWAKRLVDTMTRLEVLRERGRCRELFIWGFVNDTLILGCIDEIVRQPSKNNPAMNAGKGPLRIDVSSSQNDLAKFFKIKSRGSPSPSRQRQRSIHSTVPHDLPTFQLIDNKTRKSEYIPPHADTLPSRLQLMLYWRLLSDLVSNSDPFNFDLLWARLELDPRKEFSNLFQHEVLTLMLNNGLDTDGADINCLQSLIGPFRSMVAKMQMAGNIDDILCLVYRMREGGREKKRRRLDSPSRKAPPLQDTPAEVVDPTESILQDSVEAVVGSEDPELQWALSESLRQSRQDGGEGGAIMGNGEMTALSTEALNTSVKDSSSSSPSDKRIIGKKKFKYNAESLNTHVSNVLDWWHGKRTPKGVELNETQRCLTCEYREGCEWREEKAKEVASQVPSLSAPQNEELQEALSV